MSVQIYEGDALAVLKTLESESVQVCVTSPPYFNLRDYGHPGQIGLESSPAAFIAALLDVFDEIKRVLRPDGLAFVNLGDSYSGSGKGPSGHNGIGNQEQRQGFIGGSKQRTNAGSLHGGNHEYDYRGIPSKNLMLIPERFAIGMQDRGWWVRSRIAWCKTSAMPESVRDRPTSAWEHIYLFAKSRQYFWDADAVRGLKDIGVTSVVQGANLGHERIVLGQDFGLGAPPPSRARTPSGIDDGGHLIENAVRYATALFQSTQFQGEIGLSALDPEVRRDLLDSANRCLIGESPDVHRSPLIDGLTREAYGAAEDLLKKLQSLSVALLNGDALGVGLTAPESTNTPGVGRNGDAAIGVNDTGSIGQLKLSAHNKEYTPMRPTSSGANLRNFWLLGPEPSREQHYASFPTAIPRICILAGTSEKGACPACGAPWVRVVESRKLPRQSLSDVRHTANGTHKKIGSAYQKLLNDNPIKTLGWEPACSCPPADPVPCVVLDPFLGSGTTALVADRLGRDAIGVELNHEYAEMARRRIEQDAGPLLGTSVEVVPPTYAISLFEELERSLIEDGGVLGRRSS